LPQKLTESGFFPNKKSVRSIWHNTDSTKDLFEKVQEEFKI